MEINTLLLLLFSTAIIIFLLLMIWFKTKELSFAVGIGLIYYFTLMGGWIILYDYFTGNKGEELGYHHYYLFDKLFYIYIDDNYFFSLLYYSVFIIIIELVVLLKVGKKRGETSESTPVIYVSHVFILILSLLAGIGSIFLVRDSILSAVIAGKSAYTMTRLETSYYFTIHTVFNRMLIFPLSLGFAIFLTGKNSRYITGKTNLCIGIMYLIALIISYGYFTVISNKNEILCSFIMAILFYLSNNKKVKMNRIIIYFLIFFILISIIYLGRGLPPDQIIENITIENIIRSMGLVIFSGEVIAAHISMYGILYYNIPFTYGSSIIYLLFSIIPRFIYNNRPEDIYEYYASSVDAVSGQGYTIHHAAGWYLNFGMPGIIIGATIFGLIWASIFNMIIIQKKKKMFIQSKLFMIFFIITPFSFTALIPTLMRTGFEGYKGMTIDAVLIPVGVIFLSSIFNKNKIN